MTTGPANMSGDKLVYNSHGQKYEVPRVRVLSLDELQRADHIAFHRHCGAYWHYAIVEWIDTERKEINVIEYSNTAKEFLNDNCSPPTITGMSIAKVVRGAYKFQDETVYLMKHERCLDPDFVVWRAQLKLGDEKYHPLLNNCEHFAMWCKTGDSSSDQVNKTGEMLLKDAGVASSKELLTEEGRKGLIKLAQEIKETGVPKQVLEILEAGLTKGTELSAKEQVIYPELFKMAKSLMTPTSQTEMARELMNVARFWRFCSPADQMAVLQKTFLPGGYPGAFPLEKMTIGMRNTWQYLHQMAAAEQFMTQAASGAVGDMAKRGVGEVAQKIVPQAASNFGEEIARTGVREGSEEALTQSVSKGNSLLSEAKKSAAIEGAFAAYHIGCEFNSMIRGTISGKEFMTAATKRVMTGTGNVGGSTVGAAIGQVLIPVPGLGGVIGRVVGGMTGKYLGNLVANSWL